MPDAAYTGFVVATALASGFFFVRKRRFDFLTIAWIGAIFYFTPLFFGRVLQSSPDLSSTIPPAVYLIAATYMAALVVAGVLSDRRRDDVEPVKAATRNLSAWYLILALLGLIGTLISSRGAIIDADKVEALKQVGYLYVLFEVGASLACISAVIERCWWAVAGSSLLLAIDLLVGFRVFVVLTALGVALVMLTRDGRIRLFTKAPSYGAALLVLIVAMLLVHSARFAIFKEVAVLQASPSASREVTAAEMRGDTIQYGQSSESSPLSGTKVRRWVMVPFRLLQQSEPFIIQATLTGIVQRDVSCSPSNILKSLFLLVPPGLSKIFPNPFPPTFYEEYQPILYPNVTYGTGGNIWAEMLCRFGYTGVAIFGVLLILVLIGADRLLRKASPALAAPIAFGGVILAFYISRNDLHYTLVMLRQTAIVFGAAYMLSVIAARMPGIKPWI